MNPLLAVPQSGTVSRHFPRHAERLTHGATRPFVMALILFLLMLAAASARASCTYSNSQGNGNNQGGNSTSYVTFNPPSTISVPVGTPNNTVIYTSPTVSPSPILDMTCNPPQYVLFGVNNLIGSQPAWGSILFPTNVPGISYRIAHPDSSYYLAVYPAGWQYISTTTFSVQSSLELVKTGPITPGSVLNAGNFANWQWGTLTPETFVLGNSVTFTQAGCQVNNSNIVVLLPTLPTSAFGGNNTTAGDTAFSIDLTCTRGATLYITLDTNRPDRRRPGTIRATGSAGGVGIQVLDGNGTPVTFGSASLVGATPDGALAIPYVARYIQRNNGGVTPGTVSATATFTLSYQ